MLVDLMKVGMIGAGNVTRFHVPGWQASPDAELVAGADMDETLLKSWGRENGVPRLYADWRELVADPDIDIIDICTPNMVHAPMAIAALEAGKHVLCEKPLATRTDEIRQMIAARDASGKQLMTAQHWRFAGSSQAMKTEIGAGALGEVYHARSWMMRRNGYIPTPSFVHQAVAGGGATMDIGVHVLDLTMWLMGNPKPLSVSGVARKELAGQPGQFSRMRPNMETKDDWDVEEFASAFVRFDNGATLILEVSWLLHHDTPGTDMQVWLYGRDGGCHWPSGKFLNSNLQTQQLYDRTLQFTPEPLEPHAQECVEFAAALRAGAASPVPAEQSLDVMSILEGIYASQKEGREVRL